MITTIITGSMVAIVGAILGYINSRANKRRDKRLERMERANIQRHKENVAIREADRELLLKSSKVTELLARKYNGEGINGELQEAEDDLERTREKLQSLTRHIFYEHMEGVRHDQ